MRQIWAGSCWWSLQHHLQHVAKLKCRLCVRSWRPTSLLARRSLTCHWCDISSLAYLVAVRELMMQLSWHSRQLRTAACLYENTGVQWWMVGSVNIASHVLLCCHCDLNYKLMFCFADFPASRSVLPQNDAQNVQYHYYYYYLYV